MIKCPFILLHIVVLIVIWKFSLLPWGDTIVLFNVWCFGFVFLHCCIFFMMAHLADIVGALQCCLLLTVLMAVRCKRTVLPDIYEI